MLKKSGGTVKASVPGAAKAGMPGILGTGATGGPPGKERAITPLIQTHTANNLPLVTEREETNA